MTSKPVPGRIWPVSRDKELAPAAQLKILLHVLYAAWSLNIFKVIACWLRDDKCTEDSDEDVDIVEPDLTEQREDLVHDDTSVQLVQDLQHVAVCQQINMHPPGLPTKV